MNFRFALSLGVFAVLAAGAAEAQDAGLFAPQYDSAMMQAEPFEGLYGGVAFGLMNSNKKVFYPNANGYRVPAGVFAGYNWRLTPWLVGGVEAQLEGAYEWQANTFGTNAFALARLGFMTSDDFAVYEMAGLGLIDGNSAYALGIGLEQRVTDTFSIRAESLGFGQLVAPAGVTHYGGVMGMKITAGALWYLSDGTQSVSTASPFARQTTRFSGPYLGLYAGGGYNPSNTFFGGDAFYGWHITRFFQGGIAGWNYDTGSIFRVGGEVQAGVNFNTSGQIGTDAQVLARVGAVPFDGLMVYATGGFGVVNNETAYTIGGGAEYAVWGPNTLRLDVQALGRTNPALPYNTAGITAVKATIGTLWHLN